MNVIKKFLLFTAIFLLFIIIKPIEENQFFIHLQNNVRDKVEVLLNEDTSYKNNVLKVPKKQEFAVNNIQLNMSQKEVENKIGRPKRVTSNEYGTKWYTYYNDDYQNFLMVSYINNKVNALFSNQNIITSKSKIKYNTPKKVVEQRLGKPVDKIAKGRNRFVVKNDEYDVFGSVAK